MTAKTTNFIDEWFGQVSRAFKAGATGLDTFKSFLRRLTPHYDSPDTEQGHTKLNTFGVCTGTLFCDYSRRFQVIVSTVTGSERALAPGVDAVLEAVRMAVNGQFPTLMHTMYRGSMATDARP